MISELSAASSNPIEESTIGPTRSRIDLGLAQCDSFDDLFIICSSLYLSLFKSYSNTNKKYNHEDVRILSGY